MSRSQSGNDPGQLSQVVAAALHFAALDREVDFAAAFVAEHGLRNFVPRKLFASARSWNVLEPLPVAPMTSSVVFASSMVFAAAVCHTEMTSWTTASEPIQANFLGSNLTSCGLVAANTIVVASGVPMTVPSLGAILKMVICCRDAAAPRHDLQDDGWIAGTMAAQVLDEITGVKAP